MHPLSRDACNPAEGMTFRAGGRRYVLGGKIGDGAVGLVRRATDANSGTIRAIKFLAPDPKYIEESSFDDVAGRFRHEGERGAHLEHDCLVKIVTHEQNDKGKCFECRTVKNPFIVMDCVRGHTLESLIRHLGKTNDSGVHISKQTLTIAVALTGAVRYLHDRRIIHRDVKPANVFLSTNAVGATPTEIRLGDFGVTKWGDFLAAAATGMLTATSQQGLGTLKYMSPEQALRPKDVTVRSDIYSLAITLFELFTGRILASPHHVYEIKEARSMRTSLIGKLNALGIHTASFGGVTDSLFELLFEMFSGPTHRPSSKKVEGRLGYLLEVVATNDD